MTWHQAGGKLRRCLREADQVVPVAKLALLIRLKLFTLVRSTLSAAFIQRVFRFAREFNRQGLKLFLLLLLVGKGYPLQFLLPLSFLLLQILRKRDPNHLLY